MEADPSIKPRTINDLPNELLTSILENLKINDLIQCSLVCRRFKLICKDVKISELIISDKIENIRDFWFYTSKRFNHQDAIDVKTFSRHRLTFGLDKVKRLCFMGYRTEYDQLNLNSLTQLEQIRIHMKYSWERFQLNVDLPNLKIAEINTECYVQTFHVTAPKLEMLKCFSFDVIHLVHPETVTHLDVNAYSSAISVLNNLQFVQFPYIYVNAAERTNVISMLPKLSTIALYQNPTFNRLSTFNNHLLALKECLSSLVNRKQSQRLDLKIYVECVEMNSTAKVVEFCQTPTLSFQIKNYDSLQGSIVGATIDYNQLIYLTQYEVPDDFAKKYFNTRSIRVTEEVVNPKHLFRFLNSFDYLSKLYLNSTLLDQSFYDKLGQLNQLRKLVIENGSSSILNYDFLLRLSLLEEFETDSESLQLFYVATALFTRLKYLRTMRFFSDDDINIVKQKSDNYSLFCYCRQHLNFNFNFDGLVRMINAYSGLIQRRANLEKNEIFCLLRTIGRKFFDRRKL